MPPLGYWYWATQFVSCAERIEHSLESDRGIIWIGHCSRPHGHYLSCGIRVLHSEAGVQVCSYNHSSCLPRQCISSTGAHEVHHGQAIEAGHRREEAIEQGGMDERIDAVPSSSRPVRIACRVP